MEETAARELLAKYWYENEYSAIDSTDLEAAKRSRDRFNNWCDENLKDFEPTPVLLEKAREEAERISKEYIFFDKEDFIQGAQFIINQLNERKSK